MPVKLVGGEEMLGIAVAADHIGTVQRDGVPERVGGGQKLRVAGEFIFAGDADDLGNLRVGVQSIQPVLPFSSGPITRWWLNISDRCK